MGRNKVLSRGWRPGAKVPYHQHMPYWPNSHCARQDKYNLKLALNNNDMALKNLLFLSRDQCEHFPLQR